MAKLLLEVKKHMELSHFSSQRYKKIDAATTLNAEVFKEQLAKFAWHTENLSSKAEIFIKEKSAHRRGLSARKTDI